MSQRETKTVSREEAQDQFQELLDQVTRDKTPITIEVDGNPVAIMTPFEYYERRQARRRFLDMVERAQRRSNLSAEEADELAREAVESARERTV